MPLWLFSLPTFVLIQVRRRPKKLITYLPTTCSSKMISNHKWRSRLKGNYMYGFCGTCASINQCEKFTINMSEGFPLSSLHVCARQELYICGKRTRESTFWLSFNFWGIFGQFFLVPLKTAPSTMCQFTTSAHIGLHLDDAKWFIHTKMERVKRKRNLMEKLFHWHVCGCIQAVCDVAN